MEEKETKAAKAAPKARKPRAKKESAKEAKAPEAPQAQTEPKTPELPREEPKAKPSISDVEVAKKLINIFQSAQDRKLQFNLSFEYVRKMLEYKTCYYTGKTFTEDGPLARSFDRVDSDKGYIEGNVVACTIEINGKKSNLSFEEISCLYHKLASKKEKSAKKEIKKEEPADKKEARSDDFFAIEDPKA